jgi:hypothetical protein
MGCGTVTSGTDLQAPEDVPKPSWAQVAAKTARGPFFISENPGIIIWLVVTGTWLDDDFPETLGNNYNHHPNCR